MVGESPLALTGSTIPLEPYEMISLEPVAVNLSDAPCEKSHSYVVPSAGSAGHVLSRGLQDVNVCAKTTGNEVANTKNVVED